MPYQVKLPVFEGPFDLLLSLISRQKVSIYDIQVAQITEEYLGYLEKMRRLDLEIASEFLLVAATLLEIKSMGLLPHPSPVEDDDVMTAYEQRRLLIERLIEYRKFKNAAAMLAGRIQTEQHYFPGRPGLEERFEDLLPDFLADVDICEFKRLMDKLLERECVRLIDANHIVNIKTTVESKINEVLERLDSAGSLLFRDLTAGVRREEVVATFLAFLELYKRDEADLRQAVTFGDIEIIKTRAG
jgi:segregation and condensation protein A